MFLFFVLPVVMAGTIPSCNHSAPSLIEIPRAVWYGVQRDSPQLQKNRFGLDFNLVPAHGLGGPTVALLASARLPGGYGERYGGRIPGATLIVAVDAVTGQVYYGVAERYDAAPLISATDDEVAKRLTGEDSKLLSVEVYFNVDLAEQLRLPPIANTYYVFLWLDDVVSPIRTLQVPANPSRSAEDLLSTQRPSEIIEFGDFPVPPLAAGNKIALTPSTQPSDPKIYGAWSPDPANIASQRAKAAPYYLTLLAFNHRDRRLGWVSVDVTQLPTGTNLSRFRVDPLKIVGASDMRQKIFTLAVSGEVMSKVLVGWLE